MSEACKLAGTSRAGGGITAIACSAARWLSASSTAFVNSSTNSGIPSVRSMISSRTLSASDLLPTTPSIMALTSRCPSRLIVRGVTCGRPIQGALNSGRKVTISSTRRVAIRFAA